MHSAHKQSVVRTSTELFNYVMTLYKWKKDWRFKGEVVQASEKEPEGWKAADRWTVVLECAKLNSIELSHSSRERTVFAAGGMLESAHPGCHQQKAKAQHYRGNGA